MHAYPWLLLIAAFLSALLAGFLFAFAVVVMPGTQELNDRDLLRSFQAIDRVIQAGQPLFMLVWIGTPVTLLATAVLAAIYQNGPERVLAITAAAAHLLLVQLPTATINIPLNNAVQALDIETLEADAAAQARRAFEPPWNRWNRVRTVVSAVILGALLWLVWRL